MINKITLAVVAAYDPIPSLKNQWEGYEKERMKSLERMKKYENKKGNSKPENDNKNKNKKGNSKPENDNKNKNKKGNSKPENDEIYKSRLKKASFYRFKEIYPNSKINYKEYNKMYDEWSDDKIVKNIKRQHSMLRKFLKLMATFKAKIISRKTSHAP